MFYDYALETGGSELFFSFWILESREEMFLVLFELWLLGNIALLLVSKEFCKYPADLSRVQAGKRAQPVTFRASWA